MSGSEIKNAIPSEHPNYVPFGHFTDVKVIIQSGKFYPVFITGLSGNGKTMMVEQASAKSKREYFRVPITIETDEDDLLGGFRLINGNTVFEHGPVVEAMRRGGILLLDEVDLASNKIMCLQPILEGNPILLKKTNEIVKPAKGFNIFATANTKGKGSEDGRFVGTNVLNEAFLERFPITMEQDYPENKVEREILMKEMTSLNCVDEDFADKLILWASQIRKSFNEDSVNEIIATRRLVHIVNAYAIFQTKAKAIKLCLNRFDEATKKTFLDFYSKIDADLDKQNIKKRSSATTPRNHEAADEGTWQKF